MKVDLRNRVDTTIINFYELWAKGPPTLEQYSSFAIRLFEIYREMEPAEMEAAFARARAFNRGQNDSH